MNHDRASVGGGTEVVPLTGSITVVCLCVGVCVCAQKELQSHQLRKCMRVCVCNSNGRVVSECVLVCVQGNECGDINVRESVYGMFCVRTGL